MGHLSVHAQWLTVLFAARFSVYTVCDMACSVQSTEFIASFGSTQKLEQCLSELV